jgi:hypothetical protein
VLTNQQVVKRDGANYELLGYEKLTPQQVQELKNACDRKLAEYVARRGDLIWEHVDEAPVTSAVPFDTTF